jgi:ribosomal protein S18 acetylase RimI-like enzyme
MIGTPSQYKPEKLVSKNPPASLKAGEYFMNIKEQEIVASLYVLKRSEYVIRGVFVKPEYRGKGYGKQLLEGIIAFLSKKKLPITLYTDPSNEIAITLYKKMGFQFLMKGIHGDKFIYKS